MGWVEPVNRTDGAKSAKKKRKSAKKKRKSATETFAPLRCFATFALSVRFGSSRSGAP